MTIPYTQSISPASQPDPYMTHVKSVFRIEDVTWGNNKQNYLVRYRGELLIDSQDAYEKLSKSLQSLDVTPLFRVEDGLETIVLLKGIVKPRPSNPWINLILFILTGISVIFAGTFFEYSGPLSTDLNEVLPHLLPTLYRGMAFAASLLAILLAHEFGHYLAARYHRSAVTLPYFIPFPLSPFGTMGAFIQLKEPPKNKRILLTALNLIPAGQLDGGHILYALFGKRSRIVLPFILIALIILGTVWSGWWLWAFLIFLLGRSHAEPLDQITPLDSRRKALAVFGLVVFLFVFTPIPLSVFA